MYEAEYNLGYSTTTSSFLSLSSSCEFRYTGITKTIEQNLLNEMRRIEQQEMEDSVSLGLEVMANADPDRLQQVLLNLIENACKYSDPHAPVEVALLLKPSELCIEVRDQGIGVPMEDQQRIFERFQRASNAPAGEGSGLGLSVVRLLVEGMGGQVSLRSQPGSGSVFTLHLRPVERSDNA